MAILVRGGAGYIGSHMVALLQELGEDTVVIDNLSTGSLDNIEHLFGNEKFKFIKHDVTNFIHVPGNVDYVLHFASPASPIDYLEMPIQTLNISLRHHTLTICQS